MRFQIRPLSIYVLSGKMPDIFGIAIAHTQHESDVTYACHVQANGIYMSMWKDAKLLHAHQVYAHTFATDGSHRSAAAYSALAHVVCRSMLNVDNSVLMPRVLSLIEKVRTRTTADNPDSDGYWVAYRNDVGLTDDIIADMDADALNDDTAAVLDEMRDIFYENFSFDFTSPAISGYWGQHFNGTWVCLDSVDASWSFVRIDDGAIIPAAFLQRYVKNSPNCPHVLIANDVAFEILPEIEWDELGDWLGSANCSFQNIPTRIAEACVDSLEDGDLEIEVTPNPTPDHSDIEYRKALF